MKLTFQVIQNNYFKMIKYLLLYKLKIYKQKIKINKLNNIKIKIQN